MNKKLLALAFSLVFVYPSLAQVDTSYIYNPNAPFGTLDVRIAKSESRYYYLQEDVTFSFRESSPGVRTNTFLDMTSWDSSPYTEGNLREKVGNDDNFVMNYRLLKPIAYDASYEKGYPLIIMMHGSGEKGNCWNSNCYHADKTYNPAVNDPPAPTNPDNPLLNNDHNLLHGGKVYLDAVNLSGGKLPDDPTLDTRAYSGFVLFPQTINGWGANPVQDAIRIIRLLVKKYNIDQDRIYIHGLSNGGYGVYEALKRTPWMFASAIVMSAISDGFITGSGLESEISNIKLWIFQGSYDTNPTPSKTRNYITKFRNAGAVIRYTEYPDVGHTVWNRAYKEPDFFSWFLGENKSAIHVFAGSNTICSAAGLPLELAIGFPAYQWEKDGVIIPGADSSVYIAKESGKYRARFSRTSSSPSEADWNNWSPVVDITVQSPPSASIKQTGTVFLPDLNNKTDAILESKNEHAHYYWYKDGTLLDLPGDQDDTLKSIVIKPGNCSGTCEGSGAYTLVTSDYSGCLSESSQAVNVVFNNQAPMDIQAPSDFTGVASGTSALDLSWKDNSTNETGFEIWRREKYADGTFSEWVLVNVTDANATSMTDSSLNPTTTYQYKIRAVSDTGRSEYTPSGTAVLELSTFVDTTAPSVPQNLSFQRTGLERIELTWNSSTDDSGIDHYEIHYNGHTEYTLDTDTVFVIDSLSIDSTYSFTVKAVDVADNASESSNEVSTTLIVTGLFYEHSPGYYPSLDSVDFSRPEYTGFVDNFTLTPKTQDDYYYMQFDGFLYIITAGEYQFRVSSDDGSRLLLNKQLIIDNNGVHLYKGVESSIQNLAAGAQRITVQFFDYTGADSLLVEYNGPDTDNQWIAIPTAVLKSSINDAASPSVPQNLSIRRTGLERVELTWNSSNDDSGIKEYLIAFEMDTLETNSSDTVLVVDNLVVDSTYHFAVKAIDLFGNESENSTEASVTMNVTGLFYEHNVGAVTSLSSADWSNPELTGFVENFTLAPKVQEDNFSFRFDGFLYVTTAGDYKFRLSSDDGSRLSINKTLVIDNDGIHELKTVESETQSLGEGPVRITAEFFDDTGADTLMVEYSGPDTGNEWILIPAEALRSAVVIGTESPQTGAVMIEVFPNPADAFNLNVRVLSRIARPVDLNLTDMSGRVVSRGTFSIEEAQQGVKLVPAAPMQNGLYILRVRQGDQISYQKVIIKN